MDVGAPDDPVVSIGLLVTLVEEKQVPMLEGWSIEKMRSEQSPLFECLEYLVGRCLSSWLEGSNAVCL